MKRLFITALVISLLCSLCACSGNSREPEAPVNFYYRTREIHYGTSDGVIAAEVRDSYGHTEDYAYLVEQYLNGPRTSDCVSPFPEGTALVQIDLIGNKVFIVLSSHLSALTGSDLTIACTCLARTVLEITGAKFIQISAENTLLDGESAITIRANSFVFQDDYTGSISDD